MKRSEFLEVLQRAKNRARAFGRHHYEEPALETLSLAGLATSSDTRQTNPILNAVIEAAFGADDHFSLRVAEERAWEYYEEREKANRGHIPGFAPLTINSGSAVQSNNHEAHTSIVHSDHGYGHGV